MFKELGISVVQGVEETRGAVVILERVVMEIMLPRVLIGTVGKGVAAVARDSGEDTHVEEEDERIEVSPEKCGPHQERCHIAKHVLDRMSILTC